MFFEEGETQTVQSQEEGERTAEENDRSLEITVRIEYWSNSSAQPSCYGSLESLNTSVPRPKLKEYDLRNRLNEYGNNSSPEPSCYASNENLNTSVPDRQKLKKHDLRNRLNRIRASSCPYKRDVKQRRWSYWSPEFDLKRFLKHYHQWSLKFALVHDYNIISAICFPKRVRLVRQSLSLSSPKTKNLLITISIYSIMPNGVYWKYHFPPKIINVFNINELFNVPTLPLVVLKICIIRDVICIPKRVRQVRQSPSLVVQSIPLAV